MDEMQFLVMSMAAAVVVVIICFQGYGWFVARGHEAEKAAHDHQKQAQKLPQATRWADLDSKLKDHEEWWRTAQQQQREYDNAYQDWQRQKDWYEKHRDDLAKLDANIKQIENVKAELEALERQRKEDKELADQRRREADSHQIRRDQLKEESEQLETRVQDQQQQLDKSKEDTASAKATLAGIERQAEVKREALVETQSEIKELKAELVEVSGQLGEVKAQVAERREVSKALDAEIKGLEARRQQLENVIEIMRSDYRAMLEKLTQARPGSRQGQAELWEPVLRPLHTGRPPKSEEQALANVGDHLKSLGLTFADRTLYQLHTSLKINEFSPLLVLSGISGTGKSLLPRRYAEAMGMHFLPVPVEPRWDSPADMFGFFNYMEGRFCSTELTRALIQMDPYFDEDERGWDPPEEFESMSDEILLVLLDEMNIARVEYYFSELLSKLETRTDLDASSPEQRRKAELTLEIGRRFTDGDDVDQVLLAESLMRLFIDTNVLFVGTMNEDESTQTLSDKVVDRSNVIRFGKPAKLGGDQEANGKRPKPPSLTFSKWEEWKRSPQSLSDPLVDEQVAKLNKIVDSIGRPFAHRVHRSIRAYVANYPVNTAEGRDQALADQIELRIMPKLRGIDPHDSRVRGALSDLTKLAEDLKDSQLAQAISASQAANEHQFTWLGVDRAQG